MKESPVNPFTGGQMSVIFDSTHAMKNIYNFLSNRVFELPSMLTLVPKAITACFDNVAVVHQAITKKMEKRQHF